MVFICDPDLSMLAMQDLFRTAGDCSYSHLGSFLLYELPHLKDKFVDRMKAFAALLTSTYLFQYTLTSIMPNTYTLLAPHYLIFCSMVLMLVLILIAALSAVLVNRQDHFEW